MMNTMMPPQDEMVDEGMADPALQEKYEDLHHAMNLMIDKPETFKKMTNLLEKANGAGMLVEKAAEVIVGVVDKLEEQTGPIEDEILLTLAEDLTTGIHDRYGIDVTPEQEEQILATAVALWQKEHPDRVDVEGNRQFLEEHAHELEGMAGPQEGMPQEGMPQEMPQEGMGLLGGMR